VNVLEQRVLDQGLVVPTASLVYLISEILQYGARQPNGDLRLSRFRFDEGATPGVGEVDVAISLSYGFLHNESSGVWRSPRPKGLQGRGEGSREGLKVLAQPVRQPIPVDTACSEIQDETFLVADWCLNFCAIEDKERLHRCMSHALVAIDERMILDERDA
jgi:hypothetical protein